MKQSTGRITRPIRFISETINQSSHVKLERSADTKHKIGTIREQEHRPRPGRETGQLNNQQ